MHKTRLALGITAGLVLMIAILIGSTHSFAAPSKHGLLPHGSINPVSVIFNCSAYISMHHYVYFTWTNNTGFPFTYTATQDYFTPGGVVTGTPPYTFPVDGNKGQRVGFITNGQNVTWVIGNARASVGGTVCIGSQ